MQAWLSAAEDQTYTLRFGGHSKLGSFVRQYEEIEVTFDQDDEACSCEEELIAGRYQQIGEDCGIIRDLVNGLDWQRCAVGQTWDAEDQQCEGEAERFFWAEASTLTAPDGFRTPSIWELRTLVYCSNKWPPFQDPAWSDPRPIGPTCGYADVPFDRPAIISVAFPNLPNTYRNDFSTQHNFWSSTADPQVAPVNMTGHAFTVNFHLGWASPYIKHAADLPVRLVRPAQ
nr:DUF1566 domain-containing protein [Halochromatium salexigens]